MIVFPAAPFWRMAWECYKSNVMQWHTIPGRHTETDRLGMDNKSKNKGVRCVQVKRIGNPSPI